MTGLYIHIPFCRSRCIYCDFYSQTDMGLRGRYVDALCSEMQFRAQQPAASGERQEVNSKCIDTIYLGGGTPSQLTAPQLQKLFSCVAESYDVSPQAEVTIELNPDDVTATYAEALTRLPVTRVSMGAQTFDNERLRFLHRRHTAEQVRQAVSRLRATGIANISIDLMYGFPDETMDDWLRDIDAALALDVEHLSAYSLQWEEGTPLFRMLEQRKVCETDEELSRAMYYALTDRLKAASYEHYEISNFARHGYRSRHNSNYWNQTPYIGLGAAAHSYDGHCLRQWNVASIKDYIEGIEKRQPVVDYDRLTPDNLYNERVMTRLRTCEGLPLALLTPAYRDYCLHQAKRFIDGRLLMLTTDERLHLTREGLFVSDMIISELMKV